MGRRVFRTHANKCCTKIVCCVDNRPLIEDLLLGRKSTAAAKGDNLKDADDGGRRGKNRASS
jgi:hypothetical protein